ncbi:hypothetical protein [Gluconobacter sp. Dm-62]|nr:hypothetical protein [Gluconobacter sp. Dm-62]
MSEKSTTRVQVSAKDWLPFIIRLVGGMLVARIAVMLAIGYE